MISETAFSQEHTSTWRLLAPATDLFVRKLNLRLYERQFSVLKSNVASNRRGLINEIAFNAYRSYLRNGDTTRDDLLKEATARAQFKISKLSPLNPEDFEPPTDEELIDCTTQVERLKTFFQSITHGSKIEASPKFPGAGIIDSCEGDIFFSLTLYEIKAGQRNFRAVDIKQLLTYAALNKLTDKKPIQRLGIFNPRMGISYEASIDEISNEISGCSSSELLSEIVRVISSGDLSR